MPDAPHAIDVEHLTHEYPAVKARRRPRKGGPQVKESIADATPRGPALQDVSFSVRRGEIFGILGPNGGGKTTLFRILTTLLQPTAGHVSLFGVDVLARPADARGLLGVVFQMPSLDVKLTAIENMVHQAHLYGIGGADLQRRIDELLKYFGLTDRAGELVERFSGGMRRRVEVAKALLHDPRLLLLDEPSTGLDPGARADLWQHLEQLRTQRGMTVTLTTHFMEEADRCDRLAIIARGKLIALDTPAELKAKIGGDVITIDAIAPTPGDTAALAKQIALRYGPAGEPVVIGRRIRIEHVGGAPLAAQIVAAFPGRIASITVGKPTLEDVFMHLTGHALWDKLDEAAA